MKKAAHIIKRNPLFLSLATLFFFGMLIVLFLFSSKKIEKANALLTAKIYVANSSDSTFGSTVSVISSLTNAVTTTIEVGDGPIDIKMNSDYSKAYVLNAVSHTISVINTSNNTVSTTIDLEDYIPVAMTLDASGNHLYVAALYPTVDRVLVIDTSSNTITDTFDLTSPPNAISINASDTALYVLSDEAIDKITISSGNITDTYSLSETYYTMVINSSGSKIYLITHDGIVGVFNTSTGEEDNKILMSPSTGNPVFNSSGSMLYTTGNLCDISGMSTSSNTWTKALPLAIQGGCSGIGIISTGLFYVANTQANTVSVFDPLTNLITISIPVGAGPSAIAVKP